MCVVGARVLLPQHVATSVRGGGRRAAMRACDSDTVLAVAIRSRVRRASQPQARCVSKCVTVCVCVRQGAWSQRTCCLAIASQRNTMYREMAMAPGNNATAAAV